MAEEKQEVVAEEKPAPKAKKTTKKAAVKAEVVEEKKAKAFAKPVKHDYDVIIEPLITEKSMALLQNNNKVTVKVASNANKTEIKESFQRLFQVAVTDIKIVNVLAKSKSRGGRYQGHVSGFKKAVVSVAKDGAIDLFKE